MTAFLPILFRPSPRPTVVVVLPSPAGVGVIAVTRISLPSGRSCQRADVVEGDLGLVVAVGDQMLRRDAEAVLCEIENRALGGCPRDIDIALGIGVL